MIKYSKQNQPLVVMPDNAAEPARFAARELSRYLGSVLGTGDLDVCTHNSADAAAVRLEIDAAAFDSDEAYELSTATPGNCLIRAGGDSGLVFGVYDFLRRYAGCRFSGYAPEGEYVPRRDVVEIPSEKIVMRPQSWYRGMQFSSSPQARELMIKRMDWMAKNGLNYVMMHPRPETGSDAASTFDPETGREITESGYYTNSWFRKNLMPETVKRGLKLDMNHHNLFYWLPPDKYFADHPEWYLMIDGERSRRPLQLCICTSNKEAVATLIENMLQYIRENPEVRVVGVLPEDGIGMCQCAECRKMDENPADAVKPYSGHRTPDGENRSKSRRYALLLNEVARAVAAEFPHVKVGGAAYVDLQWPPRDVQLERNIVVWLAIYWRCAAHELGPQSCQMNEFFWDVIRQWCASQPCELILYEYYMGMNCQLGFPYPMGEVIAAEWPRLRAEGVGGATLQSRDADHNVYALNYQVFARAGWQEETVDYEKLKSEFLQGMFGSLAEMVRPLYDELDQRTAVIRRNETKSPFLQAVAPAVGCMLPNSRSVAYFLEEFDLDALIAKLEKAMPQAAGHERRQADDFLQAVRYWQAAAGLYHAALAITDAENANDQERVKTIARKTLDRYEPVLQHLKSLPPCGWIRTPGALLRDEMSWGLGWLRKKL